MRKLVSCAIAALALGTAGVAQAGSLSFTGGVVTYAAAASEGNRVLVAFEEVPVRGVRVVDIGAPVTAGAGCASVGANEGFCATPDLPDEIVVTLDDLNDYANTSAVNPPPPPRGWRRERRSQFRPEPIRSAGRRAGRGHVLGRRSDRRLLLADESADRVGQRQRRERRRDRGKRPRHLRRAGDPRAGRRPTPSPCTRSSTCSSPAGRGTTTRRPREVIQRSLRRSRRRLLADVHRRLHAPRR